MNPKARQSIIALAVSGAALLGILRSEGFTGTAMIPVPGDVPTIGYGSTAGVKMGDRITEPAARERARREIHDEYERGIQACAGDVPMSQGEFDALVSLSYNVGYRKICKSSIVASFRAGDYAAGCAQIKRWTFYQGKDCRQAKYKRLCGGLVTRRDREFKMCNEG